MKILNFDTAGLVSRPSLTPSLSPPHINHSPHMAWRRALEQAQWEEKLHHQPALQFDAGDGHTPAGSDSPSGLMLPTHAVAPLAASSIPFESVSSRTAEAIARPAQVDATVDSRTARSTETVRAPSAPTVLTAASPVPQADAQVRDAQRSAAPGAATEVLGERPQWMPTALVIHVRGQQVRATLRDTQLDAPQAARLFRDLRAHLSGAGMQLMELIVNGQPVQPDFPGLPAHNGRQHGS